MTATEAPAKKYGIKNIAVGRSDIFLLKPEDIYVKDGWNVREPFDPDSDETDAGLVSSISEIGVQEPLTVYLDEGKAFISDGHRRLAAVKHAISIGVEIKAVPVKTEGRYSSEADRVFSMIVRNSGRPLLPLEMARVCKRLIDLGWQPGEIAGKAGVSQARVVQLLNLHAAPGQVLDIVRKGEVSASLAMEAVRAADGNGEEAAAVLKGAVEVAKAAGKTRATKKHMAPKPDTEARKPNLRETIKEAFDASSIDDPGGGVAVVITMPAEHFAAVREALGL